MSSLDLKKRSFIRGNLDRWLYSEKIIYHSYSVRNVIYSYTSTHHIIQIEAKLRKKKHGAIKTVWYYTATFTSQRIHIYNVLIIIGTPLNAIYKQTHYLFVCWLNVIICKLYFYSWALFFVFFLSTHVISEWLIIYCNAIFNIWNVYSVTGYLIRFLHLLRSLENSIWLAIKEVRIKLILFMNNFF